MRINVTKGSDPRGLCGYVLNPVKQKAGERPIVATNMAGQDSATLAREFSAIVNRPRQWAVKQTMAHYSVSLSPGEVLGRVEIGAVSRELLRQMGHQHCPYFAVQHHDQEDKNDVRHWHVVTATLTQDGQWVDDSFSRLRLQDVARALENQFALTPCPHKPSAEQQNLTTGEHRRKERTDEVLPKETLWSAIDAATRDRPTLPLMMTRLKAQGIGVHLWRQGERYSGISFAVGESAFAGRKLGPAYSFGGLQRHKGVYYEPTSQNAALSEILNSSSDECRRTLEDYAALQKTCKDLYVHYAGVEHSGADKADDQMDLFVAQSAIADGYGQQDVSTILRQGERAKELRQAGGHPLELAYCQQVVSLTIEGMQASERRYQRHRQKQIADITL